GGDLRPVGSIGGNVDVRAARVVICTGAGVQFDLAEGLRLSHVHLDPHAVVLACAGAVPGAGVAVEDVAEGVVGPGAFVGRCCGPVVAGQRVARVRLWIGICLVVHAEFRDGPPVAGASGVDDLEVPGRLRRERGQLDLLAGGQDGGDLRPVGCVGGDVDVGAA